MLLIEQGIDMKSAAGGGILLGLNMLLQSYSLMYVRPVCQATYASPHFTHALLVIRRLMNISIDRRIFVFVTSITCITTASSTVIVIIIVAIIGTVIVIDTVIIVIVIIIIVVNS